jgi:hypothetical protein
LEGALVTFVIDRELSFFAATLATAGTIFPAGFKAIAVRTDRREEDSMILKLLSNDTFTVKT